MGEAVQPTSAEGKRAESQGTPPAPRNIQRLLKAPGKISRYEAALGEARSLGFQPLSEEQIAGISKFVLFIGYPRSGHSLIGAILDAHPQIIISHEMNFLRYRDLGWRQACTYIHLNSHAFARYGRHWTGYNYNLDGLSQGTAAGDIRIIGDKKGGKTSLMLGRDDRALERIARLPIPTTFVHVIRNPYDNIATISKMSAKNPNKSIQRYSKMAEAINNVKSSWPPDQWIEMHLGDLLSLREAGLTSILSGLGITDIDDRYLTECAAKLFPSPNRTADSVVWNSNKLRSVQQLCERYSFLSPYLRESELPNVARGTGVAGAGDSTGKA